jgi:hypothetical protein
MKRSTFSSMILLGAAIAVGAVSYAQQPADPSQPAPVATPAASAAATPTSTTATAAPNATTASAATPPKDILKKARENGYYTKVRKGQTFFCKKETPLGTRFDTEHCLSDEQLAMVLERNQAQRDQMQSAVCSGGGSCGGGK